MANTQHNHSTHMPTGTTHFQPLEKQKFDAVETKVLHIARLFFVGFHRPASQAWMPALFTAENTFEGPYGSTIGVRVLQVVNAIRHVRNTGFSYCDPTCADCATFVTDEERYLLTSLHMLRRGQDGAACTQAMFLCQGGDHAPFISALGLLSNALDNCEKSMELS